MDINSHQPCQNLETCYPPCFTEKIIYLDVLQRALLMHSALQFHKRWCTNLSCTTADDLCQENVTSETASKRDDSSLPFLRAQHPEPMMVRASCEVRLSFWTFAPRPLPFKWMCTKCPKMKTSPKKREGWAADYEVSFYMSPDKKFFPSFLPFLIFLV